MRICFVRQLALLALMGLVLACTLSPARPSTSVPATASTPSAPADRSGPAASGRWLSAQEAVTLAYAALNADWKPTARLAFVGRYSPFCNVGCSPFDVEEDTGIGADGRQTHWIVIFADSTAATAQVFYVENGEARLVKADVATVRPAQLFERQGWVDSTAIRFRSSQRVGLELKTNEGFVGIDAELEPHPLLWMAETTFGHYDIYDATTGEFIKSR